MAAYVRRQQQHASLLDLAVRVAERQLEELRGAMEREAICGLLRRLFGELRRLALAAGHHVALDRALQVRRAARAHALGQLAVQRLAPCRRQPRST